MYNITYHMNTSFYFLWHHYLKTDNAILSPKDYDLQFVPDEIKPHLMKHFELHLEKKLTLRWDKDPNENMNLYFRGNTLL